MNIEIIEKKDAQLLSRTEVACKVGVENKTPSRNELRKAVAKSLSVSPDLVMINKISTQYGKRDVKVVAHVYKSVEAAKKIEGKPVLKKHFPEEKKEAKPAAE